MNTPNERRETAEPGSVPRIQRGGPDVATIAAPAPHTWDPSSILQVDALWLAETKPGLFVRVVSPVTPWAALVLVHGSMVHSEYYLPIAVALATQGVAVVLPDLRGHGRSAGRRGHVASTADHVADTLRTLKRARNLFPSVPMAVGGESYGGLVAYLTATGAPPGLPLAATVLSAPAFALRAEPGPSLLAWLRRAARVVPRGRLPVRLSLAGISSRSDVETISERDPLIIHNYTLGFYIGLVAAQKEAKLRATSATLPPTLALLGGRDRVTNNDVTQSLLGHFANATCVVYPDDLHGVLAEDPTRTTSDITGFLGTVVRETSASGRPEPHS